MWCRFYQKCFKSKLFGTPLLLNLLFLSTGVTPLDAALQQDSLGITVQIDMEHLRSLLQNQDSGSITIWSTLDSAFRALGEELEPADLISRCVEQPFECRSMLPVASRETIAPIRYPPVTAFTVLQMCSGLTTNSPSIPRDVCDANVYNWETWNWIDYLADVDLTDVGSDPIIPDAPVQLFTQLYLSSQSSSQNVSSGQLTFPGLGKMSSAGGALTPAAVLWGLADYVIERTEEEIAQFLLPKLYGVLCEPPASARPDSTVAWALPETCTALSRSARFSMQTAPQVFHAAVRRDFDDLPMATLDALGRYVNQASGLSVRVSPEDIQLAMLMLDLTVKTISEPLSIQAIISEFPIVPPSTNNPAANTLRRLEQAFEILKDATDSLRVIPDDVVVWAAALKAAAINYTLNNPNRKPQPEDLRIIHGMWRRLVAAQQAYQSLNELAKPQNFVTVTEAGERLLHARKNELFRALLENVSMVVIEVAELEYSRLGSSSTARNAFKLIDRYGEVVVEIKSGNYAAGFSLMLDALQTAGLLDQLPPDGLRLVTFAAELAQSTSAEDVKGAIRVLASQSQVGEHKRSSDHGFLVAVQAYGGIKAGVEAVGTFPGDRNAAFTGLFAPIGLELTLPNLPVGLFAQVLDLGALTSVRLFGDDSVQEAPEFGFRQVVAPGAFITLALKGAPLSIGIGMSLVPELREFSAVEEKRNAVQGGAFVAVDIPIFP